MKEIVLHPIEPSSEQHVWRAKDATTYDTVMLAAMCSALLEKQIASEGDKGPS